MKDTPEMNEALVELSLEEILLSRFLMACQYDVYINISGLYVMHPSLLLSEQLSNSLLGRSSDYCTVQGAFVVRPT